MNEHKELPHYSFNLIIIQTISPRKIVVGLIPSEETISTPGNTTAESTVYLCDTTVALHTIDMLPILKGFVLEEQVKRLIEYSKTPNCQSILEGDLIILLDSQDISMKDVINSVVYSDTDNRYTVVITAPISGFGYCGGGELSITFPNK